MAKFVLNGAILKIQNAGQAGISTIVNIVFQISHVITFLKTYRFPNLPWFWTKKNT